MGDVAVGSYLLYLPLFFPDTVPLKQQVGVAKGVRQGGRGQGGRGAWGRRDEAARSQPAGER